VKYVYHPFGILFRTLHILYNHINPSDLKISAFSDTPEGALKEIATAWEGIKESSRLSPPLYNFCLSDIIFMAFFRKDKKNH